MLIDCHTHQGGNEADIAIINCHSADFTFAKPKFALYSWGIHPWFIDSHQVQTDLMRIETLCQRKQIVAIGECGLDKHVIDLNLQKSLFKQQIALSEHYGLPMIIHSVKTHHIISEMRKSTAAKQAWIIHGYNGSLEMTQQFVKQNIFISFGENLFRHPEKFKRLLQQVNMDYVFLESDDSERAIVDIYKQAARLLAVDMTWIEKQIEMNFKTVFG